MRCNRGLRLWVAVSAMVFVAGIASVGLADDAVQAAKQLQFDARIYQVLTNVTGDGLTSHTLPGMNGWLQVIHQRLDDVALVMDGNQLTWNGQPEPDNPRILCLSKPSMVTQEGESASLAVGENLGAAQYMERKDSGLFELKSTDREDVGLKLKITPAMLRKDSDLMDCMLSFEYSWIKGREKIEGVNLEVGKPMLGRASAEGSVQFRVGEWSCYQTPVDSDGWIYLFLRVTPAGDKDLADAKHDAAGGADSASVQTQGKGLNVSVGGSIEVRGGFRSGGRR